MTNSGEALFPIFWTLARQLDPAVEWLVVFEEDGTAAWASRTVDGGRIARASRLLAGERGVRVSRDVVVRSRSLATGGRLAAVEIRDGERACGLLVQFGPAVGVSLAHDVARHRRLIPIYHGFRRVWRALQDETTDAFRDPLWAAAGRALSAAPGGGTLARLLDDACAAWGADLVRVVVPDYRLLAVRTRPGVAPAFVDASAARFAREFPDGGPARAAFRRLAPADPADVALHAVAHFPVAALPGGATGGVQIAFARSADDVTRRAASLAVANAVRWLLADGRDPESGLLDGARFARTATSALQRRDANGWHALWIDPRAKIRDPGAIRTLASRLLRALPPASIAGRAANGPMVALVAPGATAARSDASWVAALGLDVVRRTAIGVAALATEGRSPVEGLRHAGRAAMLAAAAGGGIRTERDVSRARERQRAIAVQRASIARLLDARQLTVGFVPGQRESPLDPPFLLVRRTLVAPTTRREAIGDGWVAEPAFQALRARYDLATLAALEAALQDVAPLMAGQGARVVLPLARCTVESPAARALVLARAGASAAAAGLALAIPVRAGTSGAVPFAWYRDLAQRGVALGLELDAGDPLDLRCWPGMRATFVLATARFGDEVRADPAVLLAAAAFVRALRRQRVPTLALAAPAPSAREPLRRCGITAFLDPDDAAPLEATRLPRWLHEAAAAFPDDGSATLTAPKLVSARHAPPGAG